MTTKQCAHCKKYKTEDLFNWKNKQKQVRHYVCAVCHCIYRKKHYQENRKKYIEKAQKWNEKQKKVIQKVLYKYLQTHPCVDCGERDMLVLDFDHRSNKYLEISKMFRYSYSVEMILKEIKKCDVRCANCHRRKTAKEKGYWRVGYID